MKTKIFDLKIKKQLEQGLSVASETILAGGLVVFPTETVYGLGANAFDARAVKKIFSAKGRPNDNPLIVHVDTNQMLKRVAINIHGDAQKVADCFMPGPLTLVLEKSSVVPDEVTAGLDSVAVRMPGSEIARELIRLSGVPIAAPSANLSGKPSPTQPKHVLDDMLGRVDVILLGDVCEIGLESTVLDIRKKPYRILRPGAITREDLNTVIDLDQTPLQRENNEVRSPGMKYRHYKPEAEVLALFGADDAVIQWINQDISQSASKTAALVFDDYQTNVHTDEIFSLGKKNFPKDAAKILFSAFRDCDTRNVRKIYVMTTSHQGIGDAFLNRLSKAADRIINV